MLKKNENFTNYHYSAIIALCDNTKLLMGQERIEIKIPKGDMIFMTPYMQVKRTKNVIIYTFYRHIQKILNQQNLLLYIGNFFN